MTKRKGVVVVFFQDLLTKSVSSEGKLVSKPVKRVIGELEMDLILAVYCS